MATLCHFSPSLFPFYTCRNPAITDNLVFSRQLLSPWCLTASQKIGPETPGNAGKYVNKLQTYLLVPRHGWVCFDLFWGNIFHQDFSESNSYRPYSNVFLLIQILKKSFLAVNYKWNGWFITFFFLMLLSPSEFVYVITLWLGCLLYG